MKNLVFVKLFVGLFLLSSCSTFLPLKTAHDETPTEDSTPKSVREDDNAKSSDDADAKAPAPAPVPAPNPSTAATPPASGVVHKEEIKLSQLELQKFAYELGIDPKKELTDTEKKQIADRKRLRELERGLDSQKERLQYSKVLPWFKNDDEKIQMLEIPSVEGRQAWINKNKIWSRAKNLREFDDVVEAQDIAIGMPAEYVKKSWGEPENIETSGNPIYRNEKWQYNKQVSTPQGYKLE
ncbi:MAG: hypothetical protein ACXVAX_12950, partial [Pseudobdellovibrio sp.]